MLTMNRWEYEALATAVRSLYGDDGELLHDDRQLLHGALELVGRLDFHLTENCRVTGPRKAGSAPGPSLTTGDPTNATRSPSRLGSGSVPRR